jgi:adenosylcobinamide kinase/adenosylcobinamide-phosphate guanylyltransferase
MVSACLKQPWRMLQTFGSNGSKRQKEDENLLTLVIGGAASGKSSFAESIVTSGSSPKRVYLATMRLWDEECEQRVKRHR